MESKYVIGVDPGAKGAAASLRVGYGGNIELGTIISFQDKKNDWRTDLFWHCKFSSPDIAVLEGVHSFPGQGVKSMFSFGERNGEIKTVLHLAKCPIQLIQPQEWQRRLGLLRKDKEDHKKLALELFPQLADVKGDVFDAVLIGYSCLIKQKRLLSR